VAGRTLTLIAKAIQNLANLVPQAKEKFMEFMVEFLEQHLNAMRTCVARFAVIFLSIFFFSSFHFIPILFGTIIKYLN